jgi:hypothetical protein
MFIMIFSVILDVLFTLGPFSCWKWNRNFVWEQQPEVYLQRVNKEWFWTSVTDCDLSWLTRKYFDSRWYLLFSWLIKCMLSIWRLDLFIKRHVSLTVNIYYSHMRKLILEPCAWICKHPWSDQKIICVFTVTRPTLIFASDPMNFYTEFG